MTSSIGVQVIMDQIVFVITLLYMPATRSCNTLRLWRVTVSASTQRDGDETDIYMPCLQMIGIMQYAEKVHLFCLGYYHLKSFLTWWRWWLMIYFDGSGDYGDVSYTMFNKLDLFVV